MKPTETTYRDYMADVHTAAEVALESLEEYPDDYTHPWEAITYATEGDSRFTNYGDMLITVLLSDTDPDAPDYEESWTHGVDLDDPNLSWSDCVGEMARVCYRSDVAERLFERIERGIYIVLDMYHSTARDWYDEFGGEDIRDLSVVRAHRPVVYGMGDACEVCGEPERSDPPEGERPRHLYTLEGSHVLPHCIDCLESRDWVESVAESYTELPDDPYRPEVRR